jgi:hypothetical protein
MIVIYLLTQTKVTEEVAQAVTFLTCIREVPASNIGTDTDYLTEVYRIFPFYPPPPPQVNGGGVS